MASCAPVEPVASPLGAVTQPCTPASAPVPTGVHAAWEGTKAVSAQVWSRTKDVSASTWGHSRNVAAATWDHTKNASEATWRNTKELSSKAVTVARGRNDAADGGLDTNVVPTLSGATAGIAGATAAGPIAGAVANVAGFGAAGVKAGSLAAWFMGPTTAAGSFTAAMQSIGATGTLAYLGTAATVGVAGTVGVAAGLGTAAAVKVFRKSDPASKDANGDGSGLVTTSATQPLTSKL